MKKKLSLKIVAVAVAVMLVFSPLKAEAVGFKNWWRQEATKVQKAIAITASIVCTGALIGLGIFYYKRNKKFKAPAQAQVQQALLEPLAQPAQQGLQAQYHQYPQDQHARYPQDQQDRYLQAQYQQDHAPQDQLSD